VSIQLIMHQGEICARIPLDENLVRTAKDLRLGHWDQKWQCWRFRPGPYTAYQLIKAFKPHIAHCDPAIKEMAITYYKATQSKQADGLANIPKISREAWNHQRRGYWFAKDMPGCILTMEMGTGKTLTAIGILSNREHQFNLIIAPKSVLTVWPEEFQKHGELQPEFCVPISGTVEQRSKQAWRLMKSAAASRRPFALIVNYDSFWRDGFASLLLNTRWDNVVFDEIHRIKGDNSKASLFAKKLLENSRHRLGLTGTLLPHSPLDAFGQFRAIDASIFGPSFHSFKNRYSIYAPEPRIVHYKDKEGNVQKREVRMTVGYKNEEELSLRLAAITYTVSRDVLDLPEEVDAHRIGQLSPKTRKVYEALKEELYAEIESGEITVANAMVKVLRLQQLTSGHMKLDDGTVITYGDDKQKLCADLMEELPKNEPLVVFTRFTKDIEAVRKICVDQGRTFGQLTGQANQLEEFKRGEFDVLGVNIRSGGVGVDLTRSCYCIYYSIGHSLGDYLQSRARLSRPGQTRPVRFYHLLMANTVDGQIYRALQSKQTVIEYILSLKRDHKEETA
jgi:SNF2 family DNA or RNA helicase